MVCIIGILFFFGTYFYNLYLKSKIRNLTVFISENSIYVNNAIKPQPAKHSFLYYLEDADGKKLDKIILRMTKAGKSEKEIEAEIDNFRIKNAVNADPLGILAGAYTKANGDKNLFEINQPLRLYEVIYDSGYYKNSFDQFKQDFSDSSNIERLYRELARVGMYTRSLDVFYAQYFPSLNMPKKLSKNDSLSQAKTLLTQNELNQANSQLSSLSAKMLPYDERIDFAEEVSFWCFILFFPIRILYYSIKWSIITLRKK